MHGLAEPLLAELHQVLAREGADAVDLRVGSGHHDGVKLGQLVRRQPWRATVAPAINEAVDRVIAGPERKSRERFLALARRWHDAGLSGVQFFVVNEDDDALRAFFPRQIRCACVPLGAGAVHWLARGKVLRSELQVGDVPVSQLLAWTAELLPDELGSHALGLQELPPADIAPDAVPDPQPGEPA